MRSFTVASCIAQNNFQQASNQNYAASDHHQKISPNSQIYPTIVHKCYQVNQNFTFIHLLKNFLIVLQKRMHLRSLPLITHD